MTWPQTSVPITHTHGWGSQLSLPPQQPLNTPAILHYWPSEHFIPRPESAPVQTLTSSCLGCPWRWWWPAGTGPAAGPGWSRGAPGPPAPAAAPRCAPQRPGCPQQMPGWCWRHKSVRIHKPTIIRHISKNDNKGFQFNILICFVYFRDQPLTKWSESWRVHLWWTCTSFQCQKQFCLEVDISCF